MLESSREPTIARLKALLARAESAIYAPVCPLEITCWSTREPVPFAQHPRTGGTPVRVGEPWAERLFDCAWMRFSAALPPGESPEGLLARIDVNGELLIVDTDGMPLRGLTNVKSTFDYRLGNAGKTVFDIPPAWVENGRLAFWADAAFNDFLGYLKDNGRVALAQIDRVRPETRALYYDLETLLDYLSALPDDQAAPTAAALSADLDKIPAGADFAAQADAGAARAALAHWFDNRPPKPNLAVSAVGHAHLDLAWLWPIRETIRKGARTFATVLYNMERYPDYKFGASQAQLFAWMKAYYPGLYARIQQAVADGRIELQGCFWVEPDCNVPNGESLARQLLHGSRFFEAEFGHAPDYCWEPDAFGYNGQLPQILKRGGCDYFLTQKLSWNVVNHFPLQSFHWEGIDGTSLLAHLFPEETYDSPAAARSLIKIEDNYAQKDVSHHALMVYGIGDGGGGPGEEHLERLRRAPRLSKLAPVTQEQVSAFLPAWAAEAGAFPRWRGELYLERHQGTLTTQALVKRNNRRMESALRTLEWAGLLADRFAGVPYPSAELDRLWKEALLYQFHDILPGSSIRRVYDECNARYAAMLAEADALTLTRLRALAAELPTDTPGQCGDTLAVFNPLGWERAEWLKRGGQWRRVRVPPMGWSLAEACEGADGAFDALKATPDTLENECLRVRFSPEGHIVSLVDKAQNRECLREGGKGNEFVVIEDVGNAWDYETDYPAKDNHVYLRRPVARPVLAQSACLREGPVARITQTWRWGDSEIRQQISLCAGSDRLEFDTDIDWREKAHMLRVRFDTAFDPDEATFEIPFGSLRRSTREDTSVHAAQIETAAQQWVDLSEADGGLALYNDCKYGFRLKAGVIDMAVLRSVPHPGAPLINPADGSLEAESADNFTDLGAHTLRYALRPHAGPCDPARLTAEARAFNTPLCAVPVERAAGALPAQTSWLRAASPAVELVALKRAEDGADWVLRVLNVSGAPVKTELETDLPVVGWTPCDLRERALPGQSETPVADGGKIPLKLGPFEVQTLRLRLS